MNKEIQEIFIDGIGSISFVGGVIRADLVRFSTNSKDEKGNPVLEPAQRLIISPQGFVQAANVINKLMRKLVDDGVLQQKKPEQPAEELQKK